MIDYYLDVNTKPHWDTLTDAKSLAANLRIMASISGHNEAADAALATMHRQWTTIKHETMEMKLVRAPTDCDKPETTAHCERFVSSVLASMHR